MAPQTLSDTQAHALFDILTHHEAYKELRDLRLPGQLARSGPPFKVVEQPNTSPLMHSLLSTFVLPLPGLRDVSTDFYQEKCQELTEEFAKAGLSESYEAGYIGIRKTLATATAALVEGPARGYYGGLPRKQLSRKNGKYNLDSTEDVMAGFDDFLQRCVYENLIDEMFDKATETDKLEDHDMVVQAAHEQVLVILASFLHYIFVISPVGPTLLTMMKKANTVIPWTAIRQTLKVGNAATMINGMIKLVLTKMTINSVTTFLGITNASDAGWNLLQTVISTVVNWDTNDLKRRSTEIEKNSEGPSKAQCELLRSFADMPREEHDKCRTMSEAKSEPIVVTIMDEHNGEELSDAAIPYALDYLSIHMSLRDRKIITNILCSRQPDLLTQAIRECVAAYDPVIRALHNAVDLSGTVADFEAFLNDLLKFAPSSKNKGAATPDVSDFVSLLRKHQGASHRFIHQVCKNGPELREWYRDYAKTCASTFRVSSFNNQKENNPPTTDADDAKGSVGGGGAGKLTPKLNEAVTKLNEKHRTAILSELDAHATYLSRLSRSSHEGISAALSTSRSSTQPNPPSSSSAATNSKKSSPPSTATTQTPASTRPSTPAPAITVTLGPGTFLRRWQGYIHDTAITPVKKGGPVRKGTDADVVEAGRWGARSVLVGGVDGGDGEAPSTRWTVEIMGGEFAGILRSCTGA